MKLTDIQDLEGQAAKGNAINTSAKTLLELREIVEWARRVYPVLSHYEHFTDLAELREDAPDAVRTGE